MYALKKTHNIFIVLYTKDEIEFMGTYFQECIADKCIDHKLTIINSYHWIQYLTIREIICFC